MYKFMQFSTSSHSTLGLFRHFVFRCSVILCSVFWRSVFRHSVFRHSVFRHSVFRHWVLLRLAFRRSVIWCSVCRRSVDESSHLHQCCLRHRLCTFTCTCSFRISCSETTLTGESRFHISTLLGIEPGSFMTGSKGLTHWTSETVWMQWDCRLSTISTKMKNNLNLCSLEIWVLHRAYLSIKKT